MYSSTTYRKQAYQPLSPLFPPSPSHQPPPPKPPYDEGYYESRTPSKHQYYPYQGYKELNYPIEETYPCLHIKFEHANK